MNQPPLPIDAYMRFLRLSAAINASPGMEVLGPNERAIFKIIMLAWAFQKPLTVREAIGIRRFGSAATLHKRIFRLREMELIDAVSVGADRRTKYLVLTSKGLSYAEKLGRAMASSLVA
jgi:DNA-binding MarR family transcriptional regulator